jgi:uroporphyrin-III C-methyltransferase
VSARVYLVGAGPGAPDLLTVRAARLLAQADVVLHDALVHPDTLALATQAHRVDVGKRSGTRSTDQRFICRFLVSAARRYETVVRLKGGDPMLFGRAQEELDALHAAGIEVEVVPGVTAALAASALLKAPLTRRGDGRSVLFLTPRVGAGQKAHAWAQSSRAADTLALYMAAGDARSTMEQLIEAGWPEDTAIALVESASLQNSRNSRGMLGELPRLAEALGSGPVMLLAGAAIKQTENQQSDLPASDNHSHPFATISAVGHDLVRNGDSIPPVSKPV